MWALPTRILSSPGVSLAWRFHTQRGSHRSGRNEPLSRRLSSLFSFLALALRRIFTKQLQTEGLVSTWSESWSLLKLWHWKAKSRTDSLAFKKKNILTLNKNRRKPRSQLWNKGGWEGNCGGNTKTPCTLHRVHAVAQQWPGVSVCSTTGKSRYMHPYYYNFSHWLAKCTQTSFLQSPNQ